MFDPSQKKTLGVLPQEALFEPLDSYNANANDTLSGPKSAPKQAQTTPKSPENTPISSENTPISTENTPISTENSPNPPENTQKSGKNASVLPNPATFRWRSYPIDALIQIRDEITRCLPPVKLSEMNLEEEMLLQYHSIRQLQSDVLSDQDLPLNQRAQVANSVSSTLSKLVELQTEVYSSERFKLIENVLIRTLRSLPEDVAAKFIGEYEEVLTRAAHQ